MTECPPLTAGAAVAQLARIDLAGMHSQSVTGDVVDQGGALWWFVFVAEDAAPDPLGIVVVAADSVAEGIIRTHELYINPGGLVGVYGPFPPSAIEEQWRDRLLTGEEALAIDNDRIVTALNAYVSKRSSGCPRCGHAAYFKPCGGCGLETW